MRGQTRGTNRQQPMKAGCWDIPLALRDLAEAIPITSENRLLLLTKNNFQTSYPPLNWTQPLRLLVFRLCVWPLPPVTPLCIPFRGNIPLGGNIFYKQMKIEKINLNRLKYKKNKLCYSYPLKHFSYVTFLRIPITANKIRFTR